MMCWGWASYDVDASDENGNPTEGHENDSEYTSYTEVYDNGRMSHYDAEDGNWDNGHSHYGYGSMDDYMSGDARDWSREAGDPDNSNHDWTSPF